MNNDLISRSALLELAHNHVGGTVDCNDIARLPAVDAVEVVRCKACLNAMKITEWERFKWNFRDDALKCGLIGHIVLPDGYCDGGVKADAEVEG